MKHKKMTEEELFRRIDLLANFEPSEEKVKKAMNRTRQTLKKHQKKHSARNTYRKFLAAAVLIAVCLVSLNFFVGLTGGNENLVYADVLETYNNSRSVFYTQIINPGTEKETILKKMAFSTGYSRSIAQDDYIHIVNLDEKRTVSLDPKSKVAQVRNLADGKKKTSLAWIDKLHDICERDGEFIREERVDNYICNVYMSELENYLAYFWVDEDYYLRQVKIIYKTREVPFEIPQLNISPEDINSSDGMHYGFQGSNFNEERVEIYKDFVWNADFDKHLFRTVPPADYNVVEFATPKLEDELIIPEIVSYWADFNGGLNTGLTELSDAELMKEFVLFIYDQGEQVNAFGELNEIYSKVGWVMNTMRDQMITGTWFYNSNAGMDNPDEIICSWKNEKSNLYYTLFGDMKLKVSIQPLI